MHNWNALQYVKLLYLISISILCINEMKEIIVCQLLPLCPSVNRLKFMKLERVIKKISFLKTWMTLFFSSTEQTPNQRQSVNYPEGLGSLWYPVLREFYKVVVYELFVFYIVLILTWTLWLGLLILDFLNLSLCAIYLFYQYVKYVSTI